MFKTKDLQAKKNKPQGHFLPEFFTWTLKKSRSAFLGFKRRSISTVKNGLECVGVKSAKNAKTLQLNVHLNNPKCPAKSGADCKPSTRRVLKWTVQEISNIDPLIRQFYVRTKATTIEAIEEALSSNGIPVCWDKHPTNKSLIVVACDASRAGPVIQVFVYYKPKTNESGNRKRDEQ